MCAHRNQRRKFEDAPYIVHPIRVAIDQLPCVENGERFFDDLIASLGIHANGIPLRGEGRRVQISCATLEQLSPRSGTAPYSCLQRVFPSAISVNHLRHS
jgi:hypothetical protein